MRMADLFYELSLLSNFHFLRPWWFLLIVPLYFILRKMHSNSDHLSIWKKSMSNEMLSVLTISGSQSKLFSPVKLTYLMCILVILVLVGPSWSQQKSPFTQDKSALVIALDVSDSMEQSDVQPSRLIRAKQKIIDLLALRGDSLTGLIAFAGSAHVVMPITNDSEMISHFLDVLDKSIIPQQGKMPQHIIPLVENLLKPTGVPGSVVLITDGVSEESGDAFDHYFAEKPHQLIVWGIGDVSKAEQEEIGSKLIPLQIVQLENLGSNNYSHLVLMEHDKADVERVNRYLKNTPVIIDDKATPWYDSGYPLVFVLSFFYLFWFRKGWTLQW